MPKVKTSKKKTPKGFDLVEDQLDEFDRRMRDAEAEDKTTVRANEALWPVFRINHQRSRYVYEMFYLKKEISRELYEWLLREGYADAALIAKWKKNGYERLCCLSCISTKDHKFGGACICRVPKPARTSDVKRVECSHCGCRGCG